jgi:hypothetical protein
MQAKRYQPLVGSRKRKVVTFHTLSLIWISETPRWIDPWLGVSLTQASPTSSTKRQILTIPKAACECTENYGELF